MRSPILNSEARRSWATPPGREMRASLAVQDAGFSEAMKKQLCMNGGSECEG